MPIAFTRTATEGAANSSRQRGDDRLARLVLGAGTTASSRSITISSASSAWPFASFAAGAAGTTRQARRRVTAAR